MYSDKNRSEAFSRGRGRLGCVGKGVAVLGHGAALGEVSVGGHEVGVPLDEREGRVVLKLVDDNLELLVDLLFGTVQGKLGDPDGLLKLVVDVEGVLEECVGVDSVDVDVDKVSRALAGARIEPLLEPVDAHVASAVGDGRSADARLARKRVHQLNVRGGSLLGREVSLARVV